MSMKLYVWNVILHFTFGLKSDKWWKKQKQSHATH